MDAYTYPEGFPLQDPKPLRGEFQKSCIQRQSLAMHLRVADVMGDEDHLSSNGSSTR